MTNPFVVEHNFDELSAALTGLQHRAEDLTPAMRKIGGLLSDIAEEAFETESDPVTGESWPWLSENYLKRRPNRRNGQMLQASAGGLASSIAVDTGDIWAQIGSNKPYAAIHQYGGTDDMAPGPAAIPARPYIGFGESHHDEIVGIIRTYIEG